MGNKRTTETGGNFNDKDITYGYKAFTCDKVPINWSFNAVFTSEKIVA